MKAYRGKWGVPPFILNVGTILRWVITFTPRLLYHPGKNPGIAKQKVAWATEPVWRFQRRVKFNGTKNRFWTSDRKVTPKLFHSEILRPLKLNVFNSIRGLVHNTSYREIATSYYWKLLTKQIKNKHGGRANKYPEIQVFKCRASKMTVPLEICVVFFSPQSKSWRDNSKNYCIILCCVIWFIGAVAR
jgi:hypothetical protein